MNGKQLKNSILQWAIQGKLVQQDPNDEPASVLLERIRAEKKRLIKEGKIKKDKNESIIFRGEDNSHYEKFADGKVVCIDDEIPFEIPLGWEWCRLGCLCSKFSTGPFGTMVHKSDYTDDGIPLVNPTNIKGQQIVAENICRVAQTKYDELRAYVLSENDIVLARRGDLSKCAIVNEEQIGWLAGTGSFFLHIVGLSLDFFIMLYTSPYAQDYLIGDSVGTTMNNLNQGLLSRMLIPVPPLSEQSRIIEHYRFIIPIIERYTVAYSERKALDDVLPIQIKKSVLQEAIQGKLVPQDTNDESAFVLLQRIKDEKLRLVKEGKLKKKDILDSTIFRGDDNKYYETIAGKIVEFELPYSFPKSWAVVRLHAICSLLDGEKKTGDGICLDAKYLRGKSKGDHLQSGKYVYSGDKIILVDGENSGEVFSVPIDGYMGSTFKKLWISNSLHIPYVLAFIRFYKDELRNSKKGAAIPHLNKDIFYNLIIGIPPIEEQIRIVQRIKEISSVLSAE